MTDEILRKVSIGKLIEKFFYAMLTENGAPYIHERIRLWHSSVDDRESYTEGFRRMNSISPFPLPFDSPRLLSLFHDGNPAALVTTDHLPIPIRLSFIYMPELSAPDGRIPTTFSRFSLDSDTLLTFSTHSSSFSLSLSYQSDDRPRM